MLETEYHQCVTKHKSISSFSETKKQRYTYTTNIYKHASQNTELGASQSESTTTILDPPPHSTNRVDRIRYTTICWCQIKPKDTTPTPFFTWHYVWFLIHRSHCFQQLRQQRRAALFQVFESFWLHHHCKIKIVLLNQH